MKSFVLCFVIIVAASNDGGVAVSLTTAIVAKNLFCSASKMDDEDGHEKKIKRTLCSRFNCIQRIQC